MVLGDIDFKVIRKSERKSADSAKPTSFAEQLASPTDRLAATVADMVLFVPVVAVVIAPFRRQALEAQMIGSENGWAMAMGSAFGLAAMALILYQTIFVSMWGATPGKRILGLKIEPIWSPGHKPRSMAAFIRAIAWVLELACLGLPWISVFGNERRRPFHDRLADTAVLVVANSKGIKRRPLGPPSWRELSMASGIMLAVMMASTLVITSQLLRWHGDLSQVATDLEENGSLCASVGEAQREWIPQAGQKTPTRLSVALSMFAAEAIDEDCLALEGDFAFWRASDKSMAYLAKGLAGHDNKRIFSAYLKKTCEVAPDSDACAASQILSVTEKTQKTSDDKIEVDSTTDTAADSSADQESSNRTPAAVESLPEQLAAESEHAGVVAAIVDRVNIDSEPFLQIWAIKKLAVSRQPERTLALVDRLSPHKQFGFFLAKQRSKALWNMNRKTEAHLALRSSIDSFSTEQRVEISRWFCSHDIEDDGCGSQSKETCEMLSSVVNRFDEWLTSPAVAAAYIKGENCADGLTPEHLAQIQKKLPEGDAQTYLSALSALQTGDKDEGLRLLQKIVSNPEAEGPFFFEATEKLVESADSADAVEPIQKAWLKHDSSEEGWSHVGQVMMLRLNALHAWKSAVGVGLALADRDEVDARSARSMAIAAYRAGNADMARVYVVKVLHSKLASGGQAGSDARSPASVDGFDEVVRALIDKRGGSL
jgi:uncharacterized RDD family membrane protein YckC